MFGSKPVQIYKEYIQKDAIENPEMFAKFEKEIAILTERSITMGLEELLLDRAKNEGMTEKELEKNTAFTHNLLTSTDFNTAKIAQLVGVSEDFVLKIKSNIK